MDPTRWQFRFGTVAPRLTAEPAGGFSFEAPQAPGEIDYLTTPVGLAAKRRVRVRIKVTRIAGLPVWHAHDDGHGTTKAMATIMVERRNDDVEQQDGRWWCEGARMALDQFGTVVVGEALFSELHKWRNVGGIYAGGTPDARPAEFAACLANLGHVGVTLGGTSFGHGANVTDGRAKVAVLEYSID